jgi:hypothetical protein
MKVKEKFVAYVDLLGFKSLVAASEAGNGPSAEELGRLLEAFGTSDDKKILAQHGPTICPEAKYLERDLDFQITQISDCVVVTTETSPAGLINLVDHCTKVLIRFLLKGFMCRGYITRGNVVHTATHLFGTGYQTAYENESLVSAFKREASERGTPFIEVSHAVRDYAKGCGDSCVSKMFERYTKDDGSVTALFPFTRFAHSFSIGPLHGFPFEAEKERQSNAVVRQMLKDMKSRLMTHVDMKNPSAVTKSQHYLRALDEQLAICDKLDDMLSRLTQPLHTSVAYGHIPKE